MISDLPKQKMVPEQHCGGSPSTGDSSPEQAAGLQALQSFGDFNIHAGLSVNSSTDGDETLNSSAEDAYNIEAIMITDKKNSFGALITKHMN